MIRMSPDLFCSDLGTFLLELIQTMIKYLFCTVAAILVLATACNRNNFPEVQTENRPIEYDLEDKVNDCVFFAGALPDYVSEAFQLRFEKIASSIDEADIIVLNSTTQMPVTIILSLRLFWPTTLRCMVPIVNGTSG